MDLNGYTPKEVVRVSRILISENSIEIKLERGDFEGQELACRVPYVHCNRIRTSYKTSIKNLELVLNLFRGGVPPAAEHNVKLINFVEDSTKDLIVNGPKGSSTWLFTHQQLGREIASLNKRYAFFFDTRTRQDTTVASNCCG